MPEVLYITNSKLIIMKTKFGEFCFIQHIAKRMPIPKCKCYQNVKSA